MQSAVQKGCKILSLMVSFLRNGMILNFKSVYQSTTEVVEAHLSINMEKSLA